MKMKHLGHPEGEIHRFSRRRDKNFLRRTANVFTRWGIRMAVPDAEVEPGKRYQIRLLITAFAASKPCGISVVPQSNSQIIRRFVPIISPDRNPLVEA